MPDTDYYIAEDDVGFLWGYGNTPIEARKMGRRRFLKMSTPMEIIGYLLGRNAMNAKRVDKDEYDASAFFINICKNYNFGQTPL